MVRAKFKLQRYETSLSSRLVDGGAWQETEMRTLIFQAVHSQDPNSENRRFWEATPSGEIRLGTVSPAAWEQFELGKEYYIDFSPAEVPAPQE